MEERIESNVQWKEQDRTDRTAWPHSISSVYSSTFLGTVYYLSVAPTLESHYTCEFTTSTCHITHVLIAHHAQVNPSLHVRICYLTCDLYCNTSARFQEIAVTIVKNYFTELLKNALVLKPVSNAKKQDTINDQWCPSLFLVVCAHYSYLSTATE